MNLGAASISRGTDLENKHCWTLNNEPSINFGFALQIAIRMGYISDNRTFNVVIKLKKN